MRNSINRAKRADIIQFERFGINGGRRLRHRYIVVDDSDALGRVAADFVAHQVRGKPHSVLALPTGKTPLAFYHWLVRMYQDGVVDFSSVTTFNLDEFYGISRDNPASFTAYMHREFFDHVDLHPENIHLLNPEARDAEIACRWYEQKIHEAGGIDLAILGIGQNGHIAFNEPGSGFDSRTRLVRLTTQTMVDNSSLFDPSAAVPQFALTMGIGTIMESRQILLLATGSKKAGIVDTALQGRVTTDVPASILQQHPRLTIILDKLAAARLPEFRANSGFHDGLR